MTYEEAMAYIEYTDTLGSVPGLSGITELLSRLGSPQEDIQVIHIAGTNGKGSICAFLDEILEDAGYVVGRYVSPTIFTYLERFQINKQYMTEEAFAHILDVVRDVCDAMVSDGYARPTSFETETAVAFCYFKEMKVDFLLLETGMGGLYDATNVCSHPVCTIIASISMDHTNFLGDTLEDIFAHKLGIMREGVPCVSYPLDSDLIPLWTETCRKMGTLDTSVMIDMDDIDIEETTTSGSVYRYRDMRLELSVPGIYQIYNSAVALRTAQLIAKMGYHVSCDNIHSGLINTIWKGRFQKVNQEPPIYVDGAHNPGGWLSLRKNIDTYFKGRKLIYVCGVFRDKDYNRMLRIMMPGADCFIAVQPDNPRALDRNILAELAENYIESVFSCEDIDEAISIAVDIAAEMTSDGKPPVIIIFGSLSFIGPIIDKAEHGGYEIKL